MPIFSWSALVFGSMRSDTTGSMNLMTSSTIGLLFVAESVGSQGVLQSDGRGDFSGKDFLDLFALVGLETDDAAEALFLAGRGIVDISAGFDGAGIDAEEGQLRRRTGRSGV